MTEEELEEKYRNRIERFVKGIANADNVRIAMMTAYKDGYDQGKANCLIAGKKADDCIRSAKDLIKVCKEKEALEAQIKKMKNCHNCKNASFSYGDNFCNLLMTSQCRNYDKWEIRG